MRILILDDNVERHERFKEIFAGHSLEHAWTHTQACKAMKKEKFDMACLDHDLGDFAWDTNEPVKVQSENFSLEFFPDFINDGIYNTSRRFLDGRDTVQWMVENEFKCPAKVLIHSWNPAGAKEMAEKLRTISWIDVTVRPFGS